MVVEVCAQTGSRGAEHPGGEVLLLLVPHTMNLLKYTGSSSRMKQPKGWKS